MRRRLVAEDEVLALGRDGCLRAEQGVEMRPVAPQGRRLHPRRRRDVCAEGLEQMADEAVRRPVGEADLSARAADARQFVGGPLLIRREHDAEGRQNDVEAGVREGQRFGVGLPERDRQAVGLGTLPAALEQRADIVGRHDVAESAGGGERRIAVAGGDVEDALVAAQVDGLAQRFADDLQRGADHRIVAGAPGDLLAALDHGEVDGGGGVHVHGPVPPWCV